MGTRTKADIVCSFFQRIAQFSVSLKKHFSITLPENANFFLCTVILRSTVKKNLNVRKIVHRRNQSDTLAAEARDLQLLSSKRRKTRLRICLKERCCQEKEQRFSGESAYRFHYLLKIYSLTPGGSRIKYFILGLCVCVHIQTFFYLDLIREKKIRLCFYFLDCRDEYIILNTKVIC